MEIKDGTLIKVEDTDIVNGHFICPDTVNHIESSAFLNLTNVTSITLPKALQTIKSNAFDGCPGLTSLILGPNITHLHLDFRGCINLTSIYLSPGIKSINGLDSNNSIERIIIDSNDKEEIASINALLPRGFQRKLVKKSSCINWLLMLQTVLGDAGLNSDVIHYIAQYAISQGLTISGNWTNHLAAKFGKTKIIKHDRYSNEEDNFYPEKMPICIAARYGQIEIITEFHENWADFEEVNSLGWAPIHYAAFYGHTGVIAQLAGYGVNLNRAYKTTDKEVATPLYLASILGHVNAINELAKHKTVDINKGHPRGVTPLFIAVQNNHIAAVNALLKLGADSNLPFFSKEKGLRSFASKRGEQIISRMNHFITMSSLSENEKIPMLPYDIAWVMGNKEIMALLPSPKASSSLSFFNHTYDNHEEEITDVFTPCP